MTAEITSRLEPQFETVSVVRQLHDVPPHVVYEVTVDDQRAVYKADSAPTGRAGLEGHILAFVGNSTSIPVPEILHAESTYYVAAWHAGAPEPDDDFAAGETWARVAGTGLATLHDETASFLAGYGRFERRETPEETVRTAMFDSFHEAALDYVEGHRIVLERFGHVDSLEATLDHLQSSPDAFSGVGDPVCCHGWATPEHVTVQNGMVICMVDFEHAKAAPGEFDYWRTVVPTFGPDPDRELVDTFRSGYESVRPLSAGFERRKPYYRLLNLIYYFESLYVQDQHSPEETEQRAQFMRDTVQQTIDRIEHRS